MLTEKKKKKVKESDLKKSVNLLGVTLFYQEDYSFIIRSVRLSGQDVGLSGKLALYHDKHSFSRQSVGLSRQMCLYLYNKDKMHNSHIKWYK